MKYCYPMGYREADGLFGDRKQNALRQLISLVSAEGLEPPTPGLKVIAQVVNVCFGQQRTPRTT
jgi:hypothetical protein